MTDPATAVDTFRILMVCTGNICRSPLAEQLLRAQSHAAGLPISVSSAGTGAMVGRPMTPQAAELSAHYGALFTDHAPTQLTEAVIANADLILTATREHRAAVVSMYPKSIRSTFTLTQFARLASTLVTLAASSPVEPLSSPVETANSMVETSPPLVELVETPVERLKSLLTHAAVARSLISPPTNPTDDDITDPYKQSQAIYDEVAAEINVAVTTITRSFQTALEAT